MRSKLQDTVSLTMGNWDLSLLQSADNLKIKSVQRFVHLSPRYNHVTLISGYLFLAAINDHSMDVRYQVIHKSLYMP